MLDGAGAPFHLPIDKPKEPRPDEGLRHLVAEMGAGQLVYGTDVPYDWPDTIDFVLNAAYLSDAEKTAILGGTLTRLLRL